MADTSVRRDVEQVARWVLEQLAAEELPYLPAVWAAQLADPVLPGEADRHGSLLGSELTVVAAAWTPWVVSVLTDVLTELAAQAGTDLAQQGWRRLGRLVRRRLRRHRPQRGPSRHAATQALTSGVPPLTGRQREAVWNRAYQLTRLQGRTDEEARRFVDLLVAGMCGDRT